MNRSSPKRELAIEDDKPSRVQYNSSTHQSLPFPVEGRIPMKSTLCNAELHFSLPPQRPFHGPTQENWLGKRNGDGNHPDAMPLVTIRSSI
jgi:hypothetical protein